MITTTSELSDNPEPSQTIAAFCSSLGNVLLPTALAKAIDKNGAYHTIRILLDSGSQSSFVSEKMANKLALPLQHVNVAVSGLNNSNSQINNRCDVEIVSNQSAFKIKVACLVIKQITGTTPGFKVDKGSIKIPENVYLSDPTFNQPGEIDLLIGSPLFFDLLCIGQIRLGPNLPTLQKTRFGWVLAGLTNPDTPNQVSCHHSTTTDLSDQLVKFWEIENCPTERALSSEEHACEAHFTQHTRRNDEGRFIVSIPLKQPIESLGDSLFVAKKRFLSLERRLAANPELSKQYHSFMQEYKELGHMTRVIQDDSQISYYLPHHGVLKEDSVTTKLRVVFNGSSATSSGISLNDTQMVGPTIQPDMFTTLWWNGPPWLKKEISWPSPNFNSPALPELKLKIKLLANTKFEPFPFVKYSNLSRLERIIAYVLRFVSNCTVKVDKRNFGPLSPTESFLLSFRRFVARRNKPSKVYSDNGTNFVGTNSNLKELGNFIRKNEKSIIETCANEGIAWSFIPARSPHFGGLWEAGIKSCKYHLKRVLGLTVFTFEELCTLLAQVEALLNSRPIAPLSSDPHDLQPLTPSHFLVGQPLVSLPDPDLTLIPENRLATFQRLQRFHQHIWKRWHKEYISELQQRQKWRTHKSDLQLGSLVLVKEDNTPPLKWKLARVVDLHPGKDGIARVATILTTNGTFQRSFAKLCPLPVSDIAP